jgi:methylated-DNA-[protein]-cysteine S-methyltransferase
MYQGKRAVVSAWVEPELEPAAVVSLHSPVGQLFIAATGETVVASGFDERSFLEELVSAGYEAVLLGSDPHAARLAEEARKQLTQYFAGRRRHFDVPLAIGGPTEFARAVLDQVAYRLPFAETVTYGEIGERAGRLRAARAVGNIMASCGFSILVPCHRVVHAGGSASGRALDASNPHNRKAWLLGFEHEVAGL